MTIQKDTIDKENAEINKPYDNTIDLILNDPGYRMRRMLRLSTVAKILDISRDQAHKLATSGAFGRVIDVAVPGASRPALRIYKKDFANYLRNNTVEPEEIDELEKFYWEKRSENDEENT